MPLDTYHCSFQSTLPREERPIPIMPTSKKLLFQSTLPREERRMLEVRIVRNNDFNPRSHERSDLPAACQDNIYSHYFNPRSHERSDRRRRGTEPHRHISIHAPTRGATNQPTKHSKERKEFQSTLPREERLSAWGDPERLMVFQSTLPREERL